MKKSIRMARNLLRAYGEKCKPLCQEIGIPQTAFDILMFLANNPEFDTARDIVGARYIKANLVSVNVESLVKEGYLRREKSPGDRRKIRLVCTEKAGPVVERGRQLQDHFTEELFKNVDERLKADFYQVLGMMERNLKEMQEGQD
ncbi:MAG: MarR family transcriptional regulator [Lachnospiraceae bacterium]|nr:MarR family transcriptional regulator [Lachnospiraceae bacterium]